MAQLAIRGHATRGKEVIEILEMLGGKSYTALPYQGDDIDRYYYINKGDNYINAEPICRTLVPRFQVFILEDFLATNPYKVGDKVIYKSEMFPIIGMKWNCCRNIVIYTIRTNCGIIDCYDSTWMKPYKEETMEEIKIAIPKGYEFAGIDDDKRQVVFTKIQPQYPKTYEECLQCLDLGNFDIDITYVTREEYSLHTSFIKLKRCRDAYWKIAGEWKPNWGDTFIYSIGSSYGVVEKRMVSGSGILVFPTEEMRDAFYENFNDLIEQCKELL